jgi:Lrp/AsnC family transcriptional regulator
MRSLDKLDCKILDLLQRDGALTAAEIGERIGLSKVPCWRRIKRMQDEGIIRQTVTLLNPKALNVGTTAFVMVRTGDHSASWLARFQRAVQDIPEVVEIYRLSGDVDYLMRICVPDIAAYDAVYKKLIASVECLDVSASFALETIKYTTVLPLTYVNRES